MKKATAILLIGLYVILSIGIQVHLHFCSGKLVQVAINRDIEDCCDQTNNGPNKNSITKNCCSNQYLDFLIDDEHRNSSAFKLHTLHQIDLVKSFFNNEFDEAKATSYSASDSSPPILTKRFLRFSSLVFYA